MSTEDKKEVDLNIEESKDGSAVIDLPESMLSSDDGDEIAERSTGGDVSAAEDDPPDDADAV